MNLRTKTLSLVLITLVFSAAALFFVASSISREAYGALERQSASRDMQRLERVFLSDLVRLFDTLEDYSYWDDTHDFLQDRNQDFVRSNFSQDTFSNPSIELVVIVDKQGTVALSASFNVSESVAKPILEHVQAELKPEGALFEEDPEEYGILAVGSQTVLIAMAPIFRSDGKGESRGIMLVGQVLDESRLKELRVKTQLDLSFQSIGSPDISAESKSELATLLEQIPTENLSLTNPAQLIQPVDDDVLLGHILMPDLAGEAKLLWSVKIQRDIHQQGMESLEFLLIAMGLVGLAAVVCVVLLLDWLVLRRVSQLTKEVAKIGHSDDLAGRVGAQGDDELGFLALSVNGMLEQLKVSKDKLEVEHERAENLLLNILPASIADQLKTTHEQIADSHEEVTVLFADLVGFTSMSTSMKPADLVSMLNDIFSRFDDLAEELGLEKIKTIGDAYMVAAGLPKVRDDHAEAMAEMALRMVTAIEDFSAESDHSIRVRIGINTGQVVAGVIGKKKFIYDLWGDTVNMASRMESSAETGMIQVTAATYKNLRHAFELEKRGVIDIKGRGKTTTYVLTGRKSKTS